MYEISKSAVECSPNSRIHIGLAVHDLDKAKRFYQTLFDHAPTKEHGSVRKR